MPVSAEVTVPALVAMVSAPVRGPMAVGAKTTSRKQEAVGERVPVQVWPPVWLGTMAKSPVVVAEAMVMVVGVVRRLVRVKIFGAVELERVTGRSPA